MTQQPKKPLDQVRDAIRLKHYACSTEKTYVYWAKRFVLYHNKRHPLEMGEKEIREFLTYLAVEENVAASTQNQALSALLFLYREILRKDLDLPLELVWAKRPKRLPTVLTKEEVQQVIAQLTGVYRLIVQLLYGSGLRLKNGSGNTFSLLRNDHRTLVVVRFVAITSIRTLCKKLRRRLPKRPASPNGSRRTRSATPSLPTYWRIITTSAPSKNSSAIKT
jgi:integrase